MGGRIRAVSDNPAWPEAHRLPEDLEEAKWRRVESVGGPISAQ